ncbi:MAG TPA: hypothetical protein VKB11_04305 [Acidimicrobiia bacterium]|nr:hypothetical protein [Acidimicrobiia bacterium]
MPVPLPDADTVQLTPPDAEEAATVARGVASAAAPAGGLTELQRVLIEALFPAMTGHPVDVSSYTPMTAEEFARELARRDLQFRSRGVQIMLLCALVLRPLPEDVAGRIAEFASELGVDEGMVEVARRFADGALGLAAFDFERNGYTASWTPEDTHALHTSVELQSAWDTDVRDSALAARWASLERLPAASIGRRVWEMYRARGFVFPGLPGSAPPLLAQHDWVHVLADYGTTVESELEVFAFVARANDDMRGFSLLAMVISLFETGYLRAGAGLFEASPGHLSAGHGMAFRIADAMRRGALCTDRATGSSSIDYLRVDWFELAELPVADVRARFNVTPKSDEAIAAGSVGPWEPGGISPFQERCGRELAERERRPYEEYGAATSAD